MAVYHIARKNSKFCYVVKTVIGRTWRKNTNYICHFSFRLTILPATPPVSSLLRFVRVIRLRVGQPNQINRFIPSPECPNLLWVIIFLFKLLTGAFPLAVKRQGRRADNWCPSAAEFENNIPCTYMACIRTPSRYMQCYRPSSWSRTQQVATLPSCITSPRF